MSAALGLAAGFVGFAFLVYAAKGSAGTQWSGKIAPGPIIAQLLLGNWPYGRAERARHADAASPGRRDTRQAPGPPPVAQLQPGAPGDLNFPTTTPSTSQQQGVQA